MGNSDVIRREFRGNSDRKKGIQTNSAKQVTRLQGVLEAEATASSPYIILKGFLREKRPHFVYSRGSQHVRPDDSPTTWSRILLTPALRHPSHVVVLRPHGASNKLKEKLSPV